MTLVTCKNVNDDHTLTTVTCLKRRNRRKSEREREREREWEESEGGKRDNVAPILKGNIRVFETLCW